MLGVGMVLMTLAGWSSVPLFLRHFAASIDTWTSNGWRYGFAALIWLPVVLIAHAGRRTPEGLWRRALVPSLINAGGQVCFTWAHYKIDPGLLTFGLRVQVIFVALGAYLLFPAERRIVRTPGFIVGVSLVLMGTAGAAMFGENPFARERLAGLALAVTSGAFFAAYGLSVRRVMQGVHPVLAFAAISQYTAGAMLVLMFALGDRAGAGALELPGSQMALLLLSAVIGIALGHVFYYTSIARLGVAVTAGVLQLQPFAVALASLAIFAERLAPAQWAGGAAAVAGAMLLLNAQRKITRFDRAEAARVSAVELSRSSAEKNGGSAAELGHVADPVATKV